MFLQLTQSYIQSMQTYQQNGIDMMKSATDASIVPPELHDMDDELVGIVQRNFFVVLQIFCPVTFFVTLIFGLFSVKPVASTRSSHELADLEEEHDDRNNAGHQITTHVSSKTASSVINSSTSVATHSYQDDEEQFDDQEQEDYNDGYFEVFKLSVKICTQKYENVTILSHLSCV